MLQGGSKFGCSCSRPVLVGFSQELWLTSNTKATPLVTLNKCTNLRELSRGWEDSTLANAGIYFQSLRVDKVFYGDDVRNLDPEDVRNLAPGDEFEMSFAYAVLPVAGPQEEVRAHTKRTLLNVLRKCAEKGHTDIVISSRFSTWETYPEIIAAIFSEVLSSTDMAKRFHRIIFSFPSNEGTQRFYKAFVGQFA
jgi:hypothetical protein